MTNDLEVNLIRRIALGDMLRRRATSHGNREAIVEFIDGERRSLTFRKLNERVNQFVWAMRNAGLEQGDRIAILGSNTSAFLTVLLGCFKGGFVAVPVNCMQNSEDIGYNIDHSEACAVFADAALQGLAERAIDGIRRDFVLGGLAGAGSGRFTAFDRIIGGFPVTEIVDIVINDDDLAQIMYTSGTTARPKGVMASHKNLYISTLNIAVTAGLTPERSNSIALLPLFHTTAEMLSLTLLHLGGKQVLQTAFDPAAMLRLFEKEQIHFVVLLPLMWKALLSSPVIGDYDYGSLTLGLYGMAPMDEATLRRLRTVFACPFRLGSGQTEVAAVITMQSSYWSEHKSGNYWGDGSIVADQAVINDRGEQLGSGEIGEIVWRSPLTMLGYYKNEDATEEARAFGWHHSGDIGFIDEDGQLCFVDRKKDIVKSGGENVSSVKVEGVLIGLKGVANAAVIGLPHPHWGEAVIAVVCLASGATLTEQEVIAHCKQHLGGFEVPKKVVLSDALPMTATGKIKKQQLRQQLASLFSEG